jgi:Rod binding domain-containing protein
MTTPISTANPGYLDFSGLAQLRGDAAQSKNGAIEKTAEQFEALFVQMMLKSMRESVVKDENNASQGADMYQDLMDRELSVQFAKRRTLGIADMLTRQLTTPSTASTQAVLEGRQASQAYPLRPAAAQAYKVGDPAPAAFPAPSVGTPQKYLLNSSGVLPIQTDKTPATTQGAGLRQSDKDGQP